MGRKFVLAIDQSTSATKALLISEQGLVAARESLEHRQYYPRQGWVEHDPLEIYENTVKVIKRILESETASESEVAAIALTNQRETVVAWDRRTGVPVHKAMVWQCQRGSEACRQLREEGYTELIQRKTGLVVDPFFSASKLKWLLDNVQKAREKADSGELLFGTIDCWLLWKLTEGRVHATDYSNASRTMLYNIQDLEWDEELFELFGVRPEMAPRVQDSNTVFGHTTAAGAFTEPKPISGLMGDSHAALFGQKCFQEGSAKATYGTGSSVVMNIGSSYRPPRQGIVTSLGWGHDGQVVYIFEGNIHATGAAIKWLVDNMELIPNSAASEELARSVDDNGGTYFVPAFVGLGAPHWDNEARAAITGMSFNTRRAHIVRAALEAIAYQIRDVLDVMTAESGLDLSELRADGGPTGNDFLMQFQADMIASTVVRAHAEEISALGSAFMAGLAFEIWGSLAEIESIGGTGGRFEPLMEPGRREELYRGWRGAVQKVMKDTG